MNDYREFRYRITKRDMALINDIYCHRLMTSRQVMEAGYFSSMSRCNRRLRQLCEIEYLTKTALRRLGEDYEIFRVGHRAGTLLANTCDSSPSELHRLLTHGPSHVTAEHALKVVDVRGALARTRSFDLDTWLPEIRVRHEYSVRLNGTWQKQVFRPDAFARIALNDKQIDIFIEVDLGTVNKKQLIHKFKSYERYADGIFQDVYKRSGFVVLFVVDKTARFEYLSRLSKDYSVCTVVSTFGRLEDSLGSLARLG